MIHRNLFSGRPCGDSWISEPLNRKHIVRTSFVLDWLYLMVAASFGCWLGWEIIGWAQRVGLIGGH